MKDFRWQNLALIILFSASVFGQLIRLTVLSRVTLTASDIALLIVGLSAAFFATYRRQWLGLIQYVVAQNVWRYLILFVLWALFCLVINASQYTPSEVFASFSYWARLALAAFVTLTVSYFIKEKEDKQGLVYLGIFGVMAVIVGYIQLLFLPDLAALASDGWDPHVGRMVSSFLDPNYFAAYVVILMAVIVGAVLNRPLNRPSKLGLYLLLLVLWAALYLTYSRSGWLVGTIAIPMVAWQKSWRISAAIALIFVVVAFLPGRLGDRIQQSTSFLNSSLVTTSSGDASAAARAQSSRQAWELAKTNLLTGVGYNAYGYAMVKKGIFQSSQLEVHSSMGADNSFLYVLATTGAIGLLLFLAFYVSMLVQLFKLRHLMASWQLFCISLAFSVGAFFNNIFFYMPIVVTWWTLIAWRLSPDEK